MKIGDRVRLSDGVIGCIEQLSYNWGHPVAARVLGSNGVVYKEQSIATLEPLAPSTPTVSPELVDRMVRLVRDLASNDGAAFVSEYKDRARDLVSQLPPEPVDPLVLRAREICDTVQTTAPFKYVDGKHDNSLLMAGVLTALRERS